MQRVPALRHDANPRLGLEERLKAKHKISGGNPRRYVRIRFAKPLLPEQHSPYKGDEQIKDADENGKHGGENQYNTGRIDQLFTRRPAHSCEFTPNIFDETAEFFPHPPMSIPA
jgi:hypothetical protein